MPAARGRDARRLRLAPQYVCCLDRTHEKALERFRRSQVHTHLVSLRSSTLKEQGTATFEEINLIGSIDHVREKVERLATLAVDHLLGIIFAANTVAELLDQMELFAAEILPGARGD